MYNYTSSSINLQQSAEKNAFDVECARIHECREKAGTIPLSAGGVGYIFYCMSGGGELCESACFPLQSGEICLFIAGGKAGSAWFKCQPRSKICIISFKIVAPKNACRVLQIAPSIRPPEGDMSCYIQMILREFHLKESSWQCICNNILDILYAKLHRAAALTTESAGKLFGQPPAQVIRSYVDGHYTQRITIATIARALFLSESTVSHTFSAEYNLTVTKYILLKRIQESKRYLAETDLPISEIAQRVGFSSLTTYYRNFRQITGVAPGDYRERPNP